MIDQAGLRLAGACALVLDETVSDADLRDAIIAAVGREPLREACAATIRSLRSRKAGSTCTGSTRSRSVGQ